MKGECINDFHKIQETFDGARDAGMGVSMRKIAYILFCVVAFGLGVVFDGLITRVPQEAHTVTQMSVLERELKAYGERHGALPATFDDLLRFSPRLDGCLTNSWGHPISYSQLSVSNAVLTTIGYGNVEFIKRVSLAGQPDEQQ